MKTATMKFLHANRRNFQTKMKSWEFTPEGMKPGQARRDILSDLSGKLIENKRNGILWYLISLEFVEFSTLEGTHYYRLCPVIGVVAMCEYRQFEDIAAGKYIPAGGQETIDKANKIIAMPIIKEEEYRGN